MGHRTPGSKPNGSLRNIAGICNSYRNVFAMMPHPEKGLFIFLENIDGRQILKSVFMAEQLVNQG
jgi:phosphoribosylformylglycinamidine synthase